jgi:methylase of polypeptide subunit release factors
MESRVVEPLAGAGIPALHVSGRAPAVVEVMVHRRDAGGACRALESAGWRLALGNLGLWRATREATYVWEDGLVLRLLWGVPSAPLPARALRGLERALWRDAQPDERALRPQPEAHVLYLAAQSVREALRNQGRLAELDARLAEVEDRERLLRLAHDLRLSDTLDRALARRGGRGLRDGRRAHVTEAGARFVRGHARPRLLRDLASGDPWGRAVVRCRFAGVEVRAGRGVFVPRLESEGLVRVALARLEGAATATAAEIGTGCGAAALALAHALPAADIHAVELDEAALKWARRNRRRLRQHNVRLYSGSLTDPLEASLRGRVDLTFAHLPCITDDTWDSSLAASAEVSYRGAGADGLDLHRRLASNARVLLRPGGALVLQVSPGQWGILQSHLEILGYEQLEVAERQGAVVIGVAVFGGSHGTADPPSRTRQA